MPLRALIVDDTRLARMMLGRAVRALRPEWIIEEAGNGSEALTMNASNPFDVMFVDVNMPNMDGLTLTTKIRGVHPTMTMALVTANVQQSTQDHGADLGIEIIGKPINTAKLTGWLERLGV